MEWLKGFFEAGSGQSSKRLMGISSGFVLYSLSYIDSFHLFSVNEWMVYSIAGYSAACLGITMIEKFKKEPPKNKEEE